MNNVINYNYKRNKVPFQVYKDSEVFMNATAMLKPFPEKRMHNFTRNKTTLEFINTQDEEMGQTPISVSSDSKLINVKWGGKSEASWFQRNLALEFARWLNPKFGVWCNQRIK